MMQICYKDTTKYRIWLFIRLFFTLIFSILPERGVLGILWSSLVGRARRFFLMRKYPKSHQKKVYLQKQISK